MPYKHIFHATAIKEYKDAFRWYEQKSTVACDKLIIEIEETIGKICANPYRYRNTYKGLRETSLKKLPFTIVYYIDDTKKYVVIISIFHHRRNPKKKYRKT